MQHITVHVCMYIAVLYAQCMYVCTLLYFMHSVCMYIVVLPCYTVKVDIFDETLFLRAIKSRKFV